jgi:hypothetical protein
VLRVLAPVPLVLALEGGLELALSLRDLELQDGHPIKSGRLGRKGFPANAEHLKADEPGRVEGAHADEPFLDQPAYLVVDHFPRRLYFRIPLDLRGTDPLRARLAPLLVPAFAIYAALFSAACPAGTALEPDGAREGREDALAEVAEVAVVVVDGHLAHIAEVGALVPLAEVDVAAVKIGGEFPLIDRESLI